MCSGNAAIPPVRMYLPELFQKEMNESSQNIADIPALLKRAYGLFRNGEFEEAAGVLEQALAVDYEHDEVIAAMKSAHFWKERAQRLAEYSDEFDKGEYLLKQWSVFRSFLETSFEQGEFALKQWVFSRALSSFNNILQSSAANDPELLYRIGRCYKGKGDYNQALQHFEACSHQRTDDPQVLAELADCYAFINEMKAAKVFFREAFYIDPQRIDITSLESLVMQRLVERLESIGYTQPELNEWIPVYGVVFGVLNVKRELRSLEYGKLKQSIYAYESKLNEDGKKESYLEPRLLNRYFWLIDHYLSSGDTRDKVDDVLRKIRKTNYTIYEQYIN